MTGRLRDTRTRIGTLLISVAFCCGPVIAACPEPGDGANWIVFASFRGGDFASSVHAIRPDGSRECRLSAHPDGRPGILDPVVSRDGSTIAFVRGGGGSHATGIWSMAADGTEERQLTGPVIRRFRNGRGAPSWSPDGKSIAFTADGADGREIRVMNADGSKVRTLGTGMFPDWSPDGSEILFADAQPDGSSAVWIMNADGSERRKLTTGVHSAYPAWCRDGERVVFSRQIGKTFDLFSMKPDGSDRTALTETPDLSEGHANCSPDGKWIAFTAEPGDSPGGWEDSVFVIPADGGSPRQITSSRYNDLSPSWLAR